MSVKFRSDKIAFPFALRDGEVCARCKATVFTHALRQKLEDATDRTVETTYDHSCSEVYSSFLVSCPWCYLVAKIVVFTAEYVNSLDPDSDDDDYVPEYDDLPMAELDCAARIRAGLRFSRSPNTTVFDTITLKLEIIDSKNEVCRIPQLEGEHAIHLEFKVSSNELPTFQKHWGRISAESDGWVSAAQTWMVACKGHEHCIPVNNFVPYRLLDVSTPSFPKLVIRKDIHSEQECIYATLSYVWGIAQPFVLTTQNERKLCQGVDCVLLPKTVQDAVHVVSRLSIRYLWVDALCIMQDSPDDKAVQLPQMANIYRYSFLTVSAANASSSSEGFLKPPEGLFYPQRPAISLALGVEHGKRTCFQLGAPLESDPGAEPIFRRAWTYQEQLLSHRSLLFAQGGVAWECLEERITYRGVTTSEEDSFLRLIETGSKISKQAVYEQWRSIRMNYCRRELSFLGDKLNAISALASEISRATGWTYMAGLWQEHLIDELLWCHVNSKEFGGRLPSDYPILRSTKARAAEAVAPSWSWASVSEGHVIPTETEVKREAFDFQLLDCSIQQANAGPFGSIKFGQLSILGRAILLNFRPTFRPDELDVADIILFIEGQPQNKIAYGATDPLDEALAPSTLLTCVAIAKSTVLGQEVLEGLMLLPGVQESYRRVGFFRTYNLDIFQAAVQKRIDIR